MKSLAPLALSLAFAAPLPAATTPVRIPAVDRSYMDLAVAPTADFYAYTCGAFDRLPIPGEYARYGVNQEIDERNFAVLKEILESSARDGGPRGSIAQRVGDFYAAGMDEAAIEAAGVRPLAPFLAIVDAIAGPEDVVPAIGRLQALGLNGGFSFGVTIDDKDSTRMIAAFRQGGLNLPERDFYLRTDPKSAEIRTAYGAHVARMLELAGEAPEAARARSAGILGLETKLAQASRRLVDLRDPEKNYNKFARARLTEVTPDLAWEGFLRPLAFPAAEQEVLVGQPEFFAAFAGLTRSEPAAVWRDYLRWCVLRQAANYLGRAFVDESFAFYGRTLSGRTEQRPRWKRVLAAADNAIGEDLGQLYVQRAFSPAAKARVQEMVRFHLQAMRQRIAAAAWMSPATKEAAYRKIATMRSKIGYPDTWRDYGALAISRDSYFGNVVVAAAFEARRELAKLGRPVDRNEWFMTPQTNNAYYSPSLNEMCFPAGILQAPFFDEHADDASNYGALASTIGHELTHGFDDEGRQYDHEGNLKGWWNDEDVKRFEALAELVVKQYDAYEPVPGLHINGRQTLGENIADIGGLRVSFEAWKLATAGQPQPTIDGFTPEQRFFIAFAQGWRTTERPEDVRTRLQSDVHSPIRWRVLGPVADFPEFYDAFRTPRPADLRPQIW